MMGKLKFLHSPDDKRKTTDSLIETTIRSPQMLSSQTSMITEDCYYTLNNKRINTSLVLSFAGTALGRVLRGLVGSMLSKTFWKLGQFPHTRNELYSLARILEAKTKNKKFEGFKVLELMSKFKSEFGKLQNIKLTAIVRVLTKAAFAQSFQAFKTPHRIKYAKFGKHLARVLQVIVSIRKFKAFLQLQVSDHWQKSFTPIDISPIPSYSRSQIVAQGFQALSYIEEVTFNPKLKEHGFIMIREFMKLSPKTEFFLFKALQSLEGNIMWATQEAFAMWKRRTRVMCFLKTPVSIHHYVDDAIKVSVASSNIVFKYSS